MVVYIVSVSYPKEAAPKVEYECSVYIHCRPSRGFVIPAVGVRNDSDKPIYINGEKVDPGKTHIVCVFDPSRYCTSHECKFKIKFPEKGTYKYTFMAGYLS